MKPKVFLASSRQAKRKMDLLAKWLSNWGNQPVPWDTVGLFQPGQFILERLLEISETVDAAVILFGEEDKEWYHTEVQPQPRDNVLIEYGIFASQLGRERTIICRSDNPKQASDLGGLIFIQLGNSKIQQREASSRLRAWAEALPKMMLESRETRQKRQKEATARLTSGVTAMYRVSDRPQQLIKIVTGSLKDIKNVDVIVSSENTYLQPARFFERSMSGTLRYLDSEKGVDGRVRRDNYLESLQAAIKHARVKVPVLIGSVVPMATTELRKQGVRYVFNAATVEGEVEKGYRGNEDAIEDAVRHCFERLAEMANEKLGSILFPLFGTGSGRLSEDLAAARLLGAVREGLRQHNQVETVFLFAYIESHRLALHRAIEAIGWVPINDEDITGPT